MIFSTSNLIIFAIYLIAMTILWLHHSIFSKSSHYKQKKLVEYIREHHSDKVKETLDSYIKSVNPLEYYNVESYKKTIVMLSCMYLRYDILKENCGKYSSTLPYLMVNGLYDMVYSYMDEMVVDSLYYVAHKEHKENEAKNLESPLDMQKKQEERKDTVNIISEISDAFSDLK